MFKKKVLHVDDFALNAPWYKKEATAVQVKNDLSGQADGNFVIRNSTSQPGNLVLTYVKDGQIKNIHLEGTPQGVHVARASNKFPCLTELVRHYKSHAHDGFQCPLVAELNVPEIDSKTLKRMAKEREKEEKRNRRMSKSYNEMGDMQKGAKWKISDVCDWLVAMDMAEYVSTFKKNRIDGVALLNLSENDLKELGVLAVGARKKILQAIQVLNEKFQRMDKQPPQPAAGSQPVATIGLVARNVGGQVKIFDVNTGEEVLDIAAHQAQKQRELAAMQEGKAAPAAPTKTFGPNDHVKMEWYQQFLSKGNLAPLLEGEQDGTFVVRDSSSNPGSFAFSYITGGKVQHKLIEKFGEGVGLKGSSQSFPNLATLIDFHVKNSSPALKSRLRYPPEGYANKIKGGGSGGGGGGGDAPAASSVPSSSGGDDHWDVRRLTKDQALAKLAGKPQGSFVIRSSDKAYAALSLVKPDGNMFHQHIDELPGQGLRLKKTDSIHADLNAFVAYFSSPQQEGLVCPLNPNY